MVKTHRPGTPKSGTNDTQANKQAQVPATPPPVTPVVNEQKGKLSSPVRKSSIGGTAHPAAKSVQPKKELTTGTPAEQQPEYYNRETRRRMQQMGTGPYAERATADPRERKRKRQERIKERQKEIKHVVDVKGPSRDVRLGRRNTYFLIGVAVVVVALIVVALFVKHIL